MATEVALIPPDRIAHIKSSCEALAYKASLSPGEIDRMRQADEGLMKPANEDWVRGRTATLLSHFYVTDMEEHQIAALADDWIAALKLEGVTPPAWALQAACVKWLATERNKPKPSDINALVKSELEWVYIMKSRLFLEDHPSAIAWHPMAKHKAEAVVDGAIGYAAKAALQSMKGDA